MLVTTSPLAVGRVRDPGALVGRACRIRGARDVHGARDGHVAGGGDRRGPVDVDRGFVDQLESSVVDPRAAPVLEDPHRGDRGAVGRRPGAAGDRR